MARNKGYILILFVLSVLFLLQTGCDRSFDAPTVDGFILEQAKHFHMEHATDLRLPGTGDGSVKSAIDYNEILVPQWDKATYHEVQFPSKLARTYEVPLNTGSIVGGVLLKEDATEHDVVTMKSSLIIQEFSQGENTSNRQMVVTVLGKVRDNNTQSDVFSYMGSHKDFTGFMVVSTLEGEIVNIFQYLNGERSMVYVRKTEDAPINAPLSGFSFLKVQGTKSSYGNSEPGFCHMCGKEGMVYIEYGHICESCLEGSELLDGIVVTDKPSYCDKCGELKGKCVCNPFACPICGYEPCQCDDPDGRCEYCGEIGCNGECRECGGGDLPSSSQDTVKSFYVEVRSNYSHMGYCTGGGGPFDMNKEVEVCAIAYPGHMFGGWTEYGVVLESCVSYTFAITSNRCLTANFFDEGSNCAELVVKYTNNNMLKLGISSLIINQLRDSTIEHGIYTTDKIQNGYQRGFSSHITIPPNKGVYSYFIHNHPRDVLLASVEDLYGMYLAYENGMFIEKTALLIKTSFGLLSIEIDDFTIFECFIFNVISSNDSISRSKNMRIFKKYFEREIVRSPSLEKLNIDTEGFKNAVSYYMQIGLKVYCTSNPTGNDGWKYASLKENGAVELINCYQ